MKRVQFLDRGVRRDTFACSSFKLYEWYLGFWLQSTKTTKNITRETMFSVTSVPSHEREMVFVC